jgi:PAS domain S-box-containing protein
MSYSSNDLSSRNSQYNLYQRMIEEVSDYAIILLDCDGYVRNWNKGAEAIKLYRESEIVGRHFSLFYFPEDQQSGLPERLIGEAAANGRAHHEGWRRRKDGSRFWGSITITALHGEEDEIIGFTKVTRDLTDKKLAEDRLLLSEERYHRMIAEVQDYAIILMDEQGHIQNWNAGAERIKGYTAAEIVGKRFEIFYTPEDRETRLPDSLLDQAREHGRAVHEGWRLRKDGSKFWGSIAITALHDKDNNIIGFSKVTRDLTEKKLAEERLIAYTAELEARNSELEQFAYVASHDLQEPLRKIRTFTELIRDNYENEQFVRRYFDKLDISAARMAELIRSLLNFSRLTKIADAKDTVDLNVVLDEVLQDMELLVREKNADIRFFGLPVVSGHHIQLVQLFSNLLGNALKFCENRPRVEILSANVGRAAVPDKGELLHERYYELIFRDNGIGFEQQYADLIFSLFQRLHEREDFEGTGIGLALCRKIVQNHEGFIVAESEPGKGAAFKIYLPCESAG